MNSEMLGKIAYALIREQIAMAIFPEGNCIGVWDNKYVPSLGNIKDPSIEIKFADNSDNGIIEVWFSAYYEPWFTVEEGGMTECQQKVTFTRIHALVIFVKELLG